MNLSYAIAATKYVAIQQIRAATANPQLDRTRDSSIRAALMLFSALSSPPTWQLTDYDQYRSEVQFDRRDWTALDPTLKQFEHWSASVATWVAAISPDDDYSAQQFILDVQNTQLPETDAASELDELTAYLVELSAIPDAPHRDYGL